MRKDLPLRGHCGSAPGPFTLHAPHGIDSVLAVSSGHPLRRFQRSREDNAALRMALGTYRRFFGPLCAAHARHPGYMHLLIQLWQG